jgi:hypothetical protein
MTVMYRLVSAVNSASPLSFAQSTSFITVYLQCALQQFQSIFNLWWNVLYRHVNKFFNSSTLLSETYNKKCPLLYWYLK